MIRSKLFWTLEKCIKNASEFSTKKEWRRKSSGAYASAWKNGWIDQCCGHMIKLGSLNERLVYSFEFSDRYVYVGLTYNFKNRLNRHLNDNRCQVYRHIKLSGLEPEYKELTTLVDVMEAVKLEDLFLEKYKKEGWNILNINKTGGLGGNVLKWTKEKCIIDAMKYQHKKEWSDNSTAYSVARKHGWLDECTKHMVRPIVHNKKWTLDKCKQEALKFEFRRDWYNNSRSSYITAVRNGWLNVCGHHLKK